MRLLLGIFPLLFLIACAIDTEPTVHEVNIYGSGYARITWFYGEPRTMVLGDTTLELTRAAGRSTETMAVSSALRVNDQPYLREPLAMLRRAPTQTSWIEGSSDMRVVTGLSAAQVLYFDGTTWFTLLEDTSPGLNVRVVPVPRLSGLRGLANLTRQEADALQEWLSADGPLVLTVMDELPSPPRAVEGVEEYLRSGFYIQRRMDTLAAEVRETGNEVFFDDIAGGSQSLSSGQSFTLITDDVALREAWNLAHGTLLTPPAPPRVDFSRETVLAVFMGSQPSGGYSVRVTGMEQTGNNIYVDVAFGSPAPGSMSTQALTSPWQFVRILRGGVQSVWIRDAATGQVLGAATTPD